MVAVTVAVVTVGLTWHHLKLNQLSLAVEVVAVRS
jgi:hypothetical protein